MTAHPFGAIVLAAYEPAEELFRRQLLSLSEQTVSDWECVIAVDGNVAPVRETVARLTGNDPRFRVVGDDERRGFYLNFERGISAVSPEARWIALCDQDDRWDANKLESLLPHLSEVSLVSGQARLVTFPSDTETGRTERHDEGVARTVLSNQFTGSLCVFDTEVLPTALPFPRVSTRAAAHDHWLAVVAHAHRGTRIIDEALQDYVQHDANVFGDPSRDAGSKGLRSSVRNMRSWAKRYEGSASLTSLLRVTFWVYSGWRQMMIDTLLARRPDVRGAERLEALFGNARRFRVTNAELRSAQSDGYIPSGFAVQYRASWIAGALTGGRRAVRDLVRAQSAR